MKKHGYSPLSSTDTFHQEINILQYLRRSRVKETLTYVLSILTCGLLSIVLFWRPKWRSCLCFSHSTDKDCDAVLVKGRDSKVEIVEVECVAEEECSRGIVRIFRFQSQAYGWDEAEDRFARLEYKKNFNGKEVVDCLAEGHSTVHAKHQLRTFGENRMTIEIASMKSIFFAEVSSPFFMFQIFSIALWIYEDYVLYSLVILGTLLFSLAITVVETRESMKKIQILTKYSTDVVTLRDGAMTIVRSEHLVPGDVIELKNEWRLPCDCVLFRGTTIINEGILTGESIPVWKTPIPPSSQIHYSSDSCKQHTLFCGTTVIQTDPNALALVTATGFGTAQGELLSSILYPKPSRFKFEKHSITFVAIFGVIALLGSLLCIRSFIIEKSSAWSIVTTVLDLLTIVIPPALPIAMSIGASFAAARLTKQNVICAHSHAINASGRVSAVCFDKTGTLTEEDMEFAGAIVCSEGRFRSVDSTMKDVLAAEIRSCVITCHSLKMFNGCISGDPQEITLHKKLSFTLVDSLHSREIHHGTDQFKIIHVYPFSPLTKRMAVVVDHPTLGRKLYVKGAPEVVAPLCSDLPKEYTETLRAYSYQGFRVLACATKPLPTFNSTLLLSDLDEGLSFIGLIVFHNPLKPGVGPLVESLRSAGVHMIVATGDHVITGMAVAREIGLISGHEDVYVGDVSDGMMQWDKQRGQEEERLESSSGVEWMERIRQGDLEFSLAVSGAALQLLCEEAAQSITPEYESSFSRLRICGRMSPAHKVLLVEELQKRGHIVAMCGDGANDCGALKAADVSVSVGNSGSAIAAGFNGQSVTQVETVIREGRAALASSFQCFKFVALYSLIQFISVNVLYMLETCILDFQFLYVDLFTIIPLAFALSKSKAFPKLTHKKPPASLFATSVITSIIGSALIQLLFIVLTVGLVMWEDYPRSVETTIDLPTAGAENSAVFLICNFQYVFVSLAFGIGPPFRESLFKDWVFVATIVSILAADTYLLLYPMRFFRWVMELYFFPWSFKFLLLSVVLVNGLLTIAFEKWVVGLISSREYKREMEAQNSRN